MTEPRGFFKEVAPSKKKKNNNNKMSSDIRTVPDLKKIINAACQLLHFSNEPTDPGDSADT